MSHLITCAALAGLAFIHPSLVFIVPLIITFIPSPLKLYRPSSSTSITTRN